MRLSNFFSSINSLPEVARFCVSGFGASFPGVIRSMLLGSSGDGLAALFLPISSRFFLLGTVEAFCPIEACVRTGAGSATLFFNAMTGALPFN